MFSQAKYLVWFCRLDAFSENSHKIKSYLCFWTSKWRQVKVSSQTFRDCSSASRYLPEIQERSLVWRDFTFISLCFSLPLFLCFLSFFTLQAPKIILSPCAFFINGSSLPHLFILSEVGPMPCPSDCIVRVALSWPKWDHLSCQCCGKMWKIFSICITWFVNVSLKLVYSPGYFHSQPFLCFCHFLCWCPNLFITLCLLITTP